MHPVIPSLLAAVALAACEVSSTPTVAGLSSTTGASSTAATLVISPSRVQISLGATSQLSTNAPTDLASQLVWTSSLPAVVAVTQLGVVAGLSPGSAVITVRYATDTTNTATAIVDVAATAPSR
jgi:hypothetical protein